MKTTIGLGVVCLGTLAAVTGCSSSAQERWDGKDEARSSAQALLPPLGFIPGRVDCNQRDSHQLPLHPATPLVAHQLGVDQQGNPVYRRSIWDLLNDLSSTDPTVPNSCAQGYGAAKCKAWHDYTWAVYSGIYGAAGYYYRVDDMFVDPQRGQMLQSWIAIPIVDITTPGYYSSPPLLKNLHTPAFAPPTLMPALFNGTTKSPASPFWLNDADHTNLWQVVSDTSVNIPGVVDGRVRSDACIAIVDPNNNLLDFSAELEEHDPNGCGGCRF